MLVVIGIIAVLTAASLVGYSRILKAGENARARELVVQAATALTALFDSEGVWPLQIRNAKKAARGGGQLLDENAAYSLKGRFTVAVSSSTEKTIGNDRFGIVTPWAMSVIKRLGANAVIGSIVSGSSTIEDHILHFAVDLDGDGIIEDVSVGGQGGGSKASSISVRATAIVWCCNKDGEILDYATGAKKDGIYSWSYGQTQAVK